VQQFMDDDFLPKLVGLGKKVQVERRPSRRGAFGSGKWAVDGGTGEQLGLGKAILLGKSFSRLVLSAISR
jgi:hypothetical protein